MTKTLSAPTADMTEPQAAQSSDGDSGPVLGDDDKLPGSPLTQRQIRYLKYTIAGMTALIIILMIAIGVRMAQIAGGLITGSGDAPAERGTVTTAAPNGPSLEATATDADGRATSLAASGQPTAVRLDPPLDASARIISLNRSGANLDLLVEAPQDRLAVITVDGTTGRRVRTVVLRGPLEPWTTEPANQ